VSRPGVAEVGVYRQRVDDAMVRLLDRAGGADLTRILELVRLGLQHEQQHQELLLMDLKHVFSCNPLDPAYVERRAGMHAPRSRADAAAQQWLPFEGGLVEIGHDGDPEDTGVFAFDNEGPRHAVYLEPFRLADRPVTCGEWLEFIADDGYGTPQLWLSDGWAMRNEQEIDAPLYWRRESDGSWTQLTLTGRRPVERSEPVVHVSHFEADAFARWAGARLPTETEWEHAAAAAPVDGNLLPRDDPTSAALHPTPAAAAPGLRQLFGDVWEWTASAYLPYPGFHPPEGAIGEYNGKFMSGQMVLRGGACVTPPDHVRATYRNFFPPGCRWMFAGVRLATDA
jgi:ergothioneine biosynthesis protein EgtB